MPNAARDCNRRADRAASACRHRKLIPPRKDRNLRRPSRERWPEEGLFHAALGSNFALDGLVQEALARPSRFPAASSNPCRRRCRASRTCGRSSPRVRAEPVRA
jgi:hypothetical protein